MSTEVAVPRISRGGSEFVQIEIPAMYFEVLRKWASVGRTIDAAVRLIEEACPVAELGESFEDGPKFVEQGNYTVQELLAIKQALSACGSACLETYIKAGAK